MRLATASILSIFACLPAFANARLPVVNVGAGSVSARAAFGEKVEAATPKVEVLPVVVERVAVKKPAIDSGEKIVKVAPADILTPKKPSSDLWARMEKPLRLPEPQEIAVIRSDFDLPEEFIDRPAVVARAPVETFESFDVPAVAARTSELDAEIAKLVELQRKADESIRIASAPHPTSISSYDAKPTVVARASAKPAVREVAQKSEPIQKTEEVSLRRVVVPMEEDVVVRQVRNSRAEPKVASVEKDMSKMSPSELKKAFKKTYLSENKHLSTYRIDDRFDVASDLTSEMEGFTSTRDLSESGGVRPLEIKIGFRGDDSALSRDNYNLLSEYAGIVVSNPKRAIQISIPQRATISLDGRKLAARRLAIVEQVLHDTGVSDQRIIPVLAQRNDESFVLRVISSDQYETISQQKRDMFGDTVGKKSYKSMTW
ncbi:MAG: hypothetical protein LBF37_03020 [Rickettsiales bacterium]|jgi:hypothetical protein|nr:hypothetical protein [Rickettsiales bacterium]